MIKPSFIKGIKNLPLNAKDWIIEIFWYSRITCFLRKVGRFILREIRWIPVLWNQEEWDFEYMYDLLKMKMKELRRDMSKDYWHDQTYVQRGIKQIDICLARLDRYENWPDYFEHPVEDYRIIIKFEEKNYNKFWKDFLAWHQGWWT